VFSGDFSADNHKSNIFASLHGMQTQSGDETVCLSVCSSV